MGNVQGWARRSIKLRRHPEVRAAEGPRASKDGRWCRNGDWELARKVAEERYGVKAFVPIP